MISPKKIKFGGIFSNELNMPDLIMDCAFESDNSEVSSFLNREAVVSETYDGRRRHITSFKYTENFAPKFTFLKKGFMDFTQEDVRVLLKYLTSQDTTSLLEVYDDNSNIISFTSIGNFSEIQLYKIANKRVVGVTAVWDSISPFCFSNLYTFTKTPTATDNKLTIDIDTDDNQPVYPRITIKEKGTLVSIPTGTVFNIYSDMVPNTVYYNGTNYYWKSDVPALVAGAKAPNYGWPKVTRSKAYSNSDEIKEETIYYYTSDKKYRWIDPYTFKSSTANPNLTTTSVRIINRHYDFLGNLANSAITTVKNNGSSETVIIDGANKVISSSNVKRIFGNDFVSWSWLPLYDGKNELTIEGNCEIEISYREARKIGEW